MHKASGQPKAGSSIHLCATRASKRFQNKKYNEIMKICVFEKSMFRFQLNNKHKLSFVRLGMVLRMAVTTLIAPRTIQIKMFSSASPKRIGLSRRMISMMMMMLTNE